MSGLSDEWCCMNCVFLDKCLEANSNLNLLGYCSSYKDIEDSNI